jgi:hypothetical protein
MKVRRVSKEYRRRDRKIAIGFIVVAYAILIVGLFVEYDWLGKLWQWIGFAGITGLMLVTILLLILIAERYESRGRF